MSAFLSEHAYWWELGIVIALGAFGYVQVRGKEVTVGCVDMSFAVLLGCGWTYQLFGRTSLGLVATIAFGLIAMGFVIALWIKSPGKK